MAHRFALRRIPAAAALIIAFTAGCGAPRNEPPASTGTGQPAGPLRVALVLDVGGVDDKSFNAAAYRGLLQAEKDLGVQGKFVESHTPADYKTNLTQFASQGFSLVFAVGYKMEDALAEVAPQFPEVKFAIVDGNAPTLPNCQAVQFKEEQGTFLAGFLAASDSKTKVIGFVGGEQIPLIRKFEAGYRAGARTANPQVKVLTSYTGDWNDINKGKSQADQEMGNGADIVFQAAGKAGLGVIEAAREKGPGYYAIGVDSDQDGVAPGRVLTSELKRLDTVVLDTIRKLKAGQFTAGNQVYDLKAGGVGLTEMKYTKSATSPETLGRLNKVREMIVSGKVVPPSSLEAERTFRPPAL